MAALRPEGGELVVGWVGLEKLTGQFGESR
jgi:hypothetical protein